MPGRRHLPPPSMRPDCTKLVRMMKERGVGVSELARRIDRDSRTVSDYCKGIAWPTLPVFRAICLELKLDYFEICEIMRVPVIPMGDVISFRAAAKKRGMTAVEVMREFIYLYADLIPQNER